jgi:hypothetical protein
MKKWMVLVMTVVAVFSASPVFAQALPNPTGATFTASPDHAAISSYEIAWFFVGGTDPVSTTDLGKPTPDALNTCTVVINVMPLAFNEYVAKVRAKAGTVASEWSLPSNTFQRVPGKPGGPTVKK